MHQITPDRIAALHALYCQLTGLDLPYKPWAHDAHWFWWLKDMDENDLKLIVTYLKDHYRLKPEILRASLRFRHLILNRDFALEYLSEAKQALRHKKPETDRESVLRVTGRPTVAKEPERLSAADHLRACALWQQLRKDIGL